MKKHNKGAIHGINEHKGAFAFVFVLFFVISIALLAVTDKLPDTAAQKNAKANNPIGTTSNLEEAILNAPAEPVRIVAKDVGVDIRVWNPTSTDVEVLDKALLSGAVRYPTSALLGIDGTVLLFGHSSYLPVVRNQAFKAFNGIQDLKKGQIISVYSGSMEYRYRVTGIKVSRADEDVEHLRASGRHLILVTCDSFLSKNHRFVVTADFEGVYAFGS